MPRGRGRDMGMGRARGRGPEVQRGREVDEKQVLALKALVLTLDLGAWIRPIRSRHCEPRTRFFQGTMGVLGMAAIGGSMTSKTMTMAMPTGMAGLEW